MAEIDNSLGQNGSSLPTLALVAYTGEYSDLLNTPTLLSQFTNDQGFLTSIPNLEQVTTVGNTTDKGMVFNFGNQKIEIDTENARQSIIFYDSDIAAYPLSGMSKDAFLISDLANPIPGSYLIDASSGNINLFNGNFNFQPLQFQLYPDVAIGFSGLGSGNAIRLLKDSTTTGVTDVKLRATTNEEEIIAYLSDITGGGGSQNLQEVTTIGNTTTNQILSSDSFVASENNELIKGVSIGADGTITLNSTNDVSKISTIFSDLATTGRDYHLPDKSGIFAMTDDLMTPNNENVVKIVASTPSDQFAYAHGTVTIGSKMIIGTRQGVNSKLLRYSGTTLEDSITVPCSLGLENIVKKADETRIYGIRNYLGVSYIWDADPLDFTDINYNVITGVNLQDSPAICTDGTYIYGVENINNCKFFKIRINDWTTISTNTWTGNGGGHWCDINSIDGVFYASSSRGYLATINNTNLTYTVNDVRNFMEVITDDNVFLPADNNDLGYNAVILGGENKGVGTGLGAVIINVDDNTIRPFDILPTVGLFKSTDCTKLYSMSNQGFVQVWNLQALLLALQSEQPYTNNTFTYRGNGFPNELIQPTDGFTYMTNWDTVNGTGMLSKIELTPVSQPIITQKEAYYNSLNSGNTLASTDDLAEGSTNLYFTNTRAVSALSSSLSTKQDTLTASNTHAFVDGLTALTTPVDADRMIIVDNSVSLAKKITWANIKATLKTYFDGLYTTTSAVATQITTALSSYATTSALTSGLATKQDTLVSATNIKTVNSISLLGSGNVSVEPAITAGTTSQYYRGDKSFQTLDKTAVGLANVDNTSDVNKPVSTATQTALDLKANKADYMALTLPYTLANSTALQKMFNIGSGSNGAFNASANKTYRFRIEFDLTGLSATSGTISFGFLGTAVITSINYKMNATKNALATITAANIQSIQTSAVTVVTAATTNTVAKGMASGTIRVTTAGTIIPAIATSVGVTTARVEANSFCEFVEIGSDTLTATNNIS